MNIQPEVVQELIEKYVEEVKKVQECSERFATVDKTFSSWTGPTRQKLQENIKNETPAFEELIETVNSYGTTAKQTADNTIELENELTRMLG